MFQQILKIVFILLPLTGFNQIKNVWALGDGEKVFRNDPDHPDKNGNFIWDGKTVHLKGLYNEVLAFQVILETDILGAKSIEVAVEAPVHRSSGKTIGGNTLKYGPQGTIEIFSEHYLHVIDSTHPNWYYGSPAAQPKKMTGWIPDALIPADALSGRGGFPLDVLPIKSNDIHFKGITTQNQGFWIDIYLPRDQKNFPPGIYYGKVQVIQNGNSIKEIPLEVNLLPNYLPDENHTNIWLFSNEIEAYFPGLSQKQVHDMIKFEAHRHRIDMSGGFTVNYSFFNQDSMNQYKPYLDGTAFTPANGYHGNGEGVGEKLFPIGMYGTDIMGNTKMEIQKQSDLWVDWFIKNTPDVKYFWYITDEPAESKYPWIKERAEWIKSNTGAGRTLPIFTTRPYSQNLAGAINYWAGYDGVELKDLSAARQNGGDHWFYNGNRPRYGSVILEGAAVDFRVNSWILYKYGINTHFIWHGTNWQHNGQGPKKHLHQNIFINPLTFINNDMDFGNGDGILFYPGRMPFYPEEDKGLNRVLPSIRLKNIRRGQQDAEIMWMAEKKVGREKVLGIINKIVPKALSEVDMKSKVPWSEKGNDYDKIRDELLKLF
jgi:glycosyl hydrolase family 123